MRPAAASILAAVAALAVTVPPAHAQSPVFHIESVSPPGWGVPFQANGTVLQVAWTYQFPNAPAAAAAAASQQTTIDWTITCPEGGFVLSDPTTTIPLEAHRASYSDTTRLELEAVAGTRDGVACTLTGRPEQTATGQPPEASFDTAIPVQFDGRISAVLQASHRQSGPQKQISYPIVVTNEGNARTRVVAEVVEDPGGKWNSLPPAAIVLEPGESATASYVVATPFWNGYVSERGEFTLRLTPTSVRDGSVTGPPVELTLDATTKGWYIPGPSPVLLLVGLAAAVLAVRRTRA